MNQKISSVLKFWFEELTPSQWFGSDKGIDQLISDRFKEFHQAASKGEYFNWRKTPDGRLAEIIILDQFSRNIYRGTAKAFEADPMALVLAQEMVINKLDTELSVSKRAFAYMPFMHSESKVIHVIAVDLFTLPGLENNLEFEIAHRNIIDRFGRYPHRNAILGRVSTQEELEFLKTHSGF